MSWYTADNEYEKMIDAQQSKRKKKDGFEGCKRCGDRGYYLAKYSREGYCEICELECYPERFNPCACCRIPLKGRMLCGVCSIGISKHFDEIRKRYTSKESWELFLTYMEWE